MRTAWCADVHGNLSTPIWCAARVVNADVTVSSDGRTMVVFATTTRGRCAAVCGSNLRAEGAPSSVPARRGLPVPATRSSPWSRPASRGGDVGEAAGRGLDATLRSTARHPQGLSGNVGGKDQDPMFSPDGPRSSSATPTSSTSTAPGSPTSPPRPTPRTPPPPRLPVRATPGPDADNSATNRYQHPVGALPWK